MDVSCRVEDLCRADHRAGLDSQIEFLRWPLRNLWVFVPALAAFVAMLDIGLVTFWPADDSPLTQASSRILDLFRPAVWCLLLNAVALAGTVLLLALFACSSRQAELAIGRVEEYDANLRLNEERYRMLVQAMATFLGWTDASGAFVAFQEGWHSYTGQTWEQYQGYGWVQAIYPDDQERVLHLWKEALASRCNFCSEHRIWHAASKKHHFCVVTAVPLLNRDGTVREWIGAVRDCDEEDLQGVTRVFEEDVHSTQPRALSSRDAATREVDRGEARARRVGGLHNFAMPDTESVVSMADLGLFQE